MKNIAFIIAFGLFSEASFAALQTLQTERGRIFIPELQGWEMGKNLFGMPFIYFSPEQKGQRSNISFTSTGVEVRNELEGLGKDAGGYKKLKLEWAKKSGALAKEFYPYATWKNSHGHLVHEIGFSFVHEGKSYVEKSLYVDCRGKLIFAKSLRLSVNGIHDTDFKKLLQEMDCAL